MNTTKLVILDQKAILTLKRMTAIILSYLWFNKFN